MLIAVCMSVLFVITPPLVVLIHKLISRALKTEVSHRACLEHIMQSEHVMLAMCSKAFSLSKEWNSNPPSSLQHFIDC